MSKDDLPSESDYALVGKTLPEIAAPELPYRPPMPKSYRPKIALVGAGGISFAHLDAYRRAGLDVAAVMSRSLARATTRRDEFYPQAIATDDFDSLLRRDDIEVLDITPHPAERTPLVEAALKAGKHVLSQKPFVTDLDAGERLVELAERNSVKLAVNQNGRWAPHFAYIREAVRAGLVGDVISSHTAVHWDHSWIVGTPFEKIDDLIFFDFAVHWFDFLSSLIGAKGTSVYATRARAAGQQAKPPLLAQALVAFDGGQASLAFDAAIRHGPLDSTFVGGTLGSLASTGPNLGEQSVTLTTAWGVARPKLEGAWFNDGFAGTMGELLVAVEEKREPLNGARGNLDSLALCFAAMASAHTGMAVQPGTVRKAPGI
ncbi:Gfo/Idh/MocA family protein [Mesorhizobium marinum]|uniref:Gfo/Idh/MocA family protein n=1 Tax=Mesorhizobium marinum TaxID=3228790 RepID=UPI0034672D48